MGYLGFGYEDAYANALAYRALLGMDQLAQQANHPDDAARFRAAAEKLKAAYFKAFYDPKTGVLAGWRSDDGQLHDYYFLFVNGIAIDYGLVPQDKANSIMDRLLAKMNEVGYTNFGLGLPGNLIPVPKADCMQYGPHDGFQIYENGGATACFSSLPSLRSTIWAVFRMAIASFSVAGCLCQRRLSGRWKQQQKQGLENVGWNLQRLRRIAQ